MKRTITTLATMTAICFAVSATAQETIKIGIINAYSGQFADPAAQLDAGIDLYLQLHGNEIAGRTIEIIRKDTGGIAPDVAKRLAQELIVRDNVDILAGNLLTPNALAVGDVSAEAEKFMVVMNATTPVIITKSDYMIRTTSPVSGSIPIVPRGLSQVRPRAAAASASPERSPPAASTAKKIAAIPS